VVKAGTDFLVFVPHATYAGSCAFWCNALMCSDQRSPDLHKSRYSGSFNSLGDTRIQAGTKKLALVLFW
jgi:hypothetical protein